MFRAPLAPAGSLEAAFAAVKGRGALARIRLSSCGGVETPWGDRADAIINGALPYELPIFKSHLGHLFPKFLAQWQDDPKRADALARARRIAVLFDAIQACGDADVPATSVLREFIGGSDYDVH